MNLPKRHQTKFLQLQFYRISILMSISNFAFYLFPDARSMQNNSSPIDLFLCLRCAAFITTSSQPITVVRLLGLSNSSSAALWTPLLLFSFVFRRFLRSSVFSFLFIFNPHFFCNTKRSTAYGNHINCNIGILFRIIIPNAQLTLAA